MCLCIWSHIFLENKIIMDNIDSAMVEGIYDPDDVLPRFVDK